MLTHCEGVEKVLAIPSMYSILSQLFPCITCLNPILLNILQSQSVSLPLSFSDQTFLCIFTCYMPALIILLDVICLIMLHEEYK